MDFSSFLEVPAGCVAGRQLVYSQRYIRGNIVSPADFQVFGGQLHIDSFGAEEVRCLSLLLTTIAHNTSDGQYISFPLLFYVDSLFQRP